MRKRACLKSEGKSCPFVHNGDGASFAEALSLLTDWSTPALLISDHYTQINVNIKLIEIYKILAETKIEWTLKLLATNGEFLMRGFNTKTKLISTTKYITISNLRMVLIFVWNVPNKNRSLLVNSSVNGVTIVNNHNGILKSWKNTNELVLT